MFLLNHLTHYLVIYKVVPLHPIMFLLNQNFATEIKFLFILFTSHYVPIKSPLYWLKMYIDRCTLHPIMFLLNPYTLLSNLKSNSFTSHYVPIKSHTYIILYFLRFSTPFLSTPEKTSQADVRNLLNYLLTTLLTPHESMDCQLPHKNALS